MAEVDRMRVGRFDWERLMLVSGLPWPTRAVLLALAVYMSQDGGNARPGLRNMAAVTGLSERALRGHLRAAVDAGYLGQLARGGYRAGKRVHANLYAATVPKDVFDGAVAVLHSPPWRRSEPEAEFLFAGAEPAETPRTTPDHDASPEGSEPEIWRSEPAIQRSEPEAQFRPSRSSHHVGDHAVASASRGAASPFGRRRATSPIAHPAIAEASARRAAAVAAKIVTDDAGVDRETADRFVRWIVAQRHPDDPIAYLKHLSNEYAIVPLLEDYYRTE